MPYTKEEELEQLFAKIRRLLKPARKPEAGIVPVSFEPRHRSYGPDARSLGRARLLLGRFFNPGLFSDPALDILLDVYASQEEGRPVDVGSCAHTARVAASTGLRYIAMLEAEQLITREPDPRDGRRVILRLTPEARINMEKYLALIRSISATLAE